MGTPKRRTTPADPITDTADRGTCATGAGRTAQLPNRRLAVTLATLGLLALAGVLGGCREQPQRDAALAAPRVQAVEIATPRVVEVQEPVRALGRLEASDETRLAFKSPGVVGRILVDIGDAVKPGQLLAVLETAELDAALARATEGLAKAERDLARAAQLHTRGLVAREQLDNAYTARDVARADAEAARFNRRHAEIRATAVGRVLARHVEAREVVAAGTPVLAVSGEARGWLLELQVADRDVVRLAPGAAAELEFAAFPHERFAARVARLAAQADPATATFTVELALDAADPRLLSGMLAHARIATRSEGEALLVPLASLVDASGESARVFVAADGRARLREVRTGRLRGDGIVVLAGLAPGEQVIVGGAAWVDDGAAVRVVPAQQEG